LRATPYINSGSHSMLATLSAVARASITAAAPPNVELSALTAAAEGYTSATAADVAAVISGLYPAYTGGPFTFLRQSSAHAWNARRAKDASRYPALFRKQL